MQNAPVQTLKLLDLPDEVLEKILGYLPFKEICKLRLVSRYPKNGVSNFNEVGCRFAVVWTK